MAMDPDFLEEGSRIWPYSASDRMIRARVSLNLIAATVCWNEMDSDCVTSFELSTSTATLTATLLQPADAVCSLVFAHGAGADHKHTHMESLAKAFAGVGISTLRFNFPFKQNGRNRVDSKDVSVDCILDACKALREKIDLPMFSGGHSFGGRMATHAAVRGMPDCMGLILCSFPLHPAGKPGIERVAHFEDLRLPALFLSGSRDALAEAILLEAEVKKLGHEYSRLHWLDTADHSYKILKRKRAGADVYEEAAGAAAEFVNSILV